MNNLANWRTIIRRIRSGKFTPILSERIYFPGERSILSAWAREINYPFPLDQNLSLPQLAQYLSATSRDDLTAKEDFLDFAKRHLLERAWENATPEQEPFLDTLEDELFDLTFSEVAGRLDFPKYESELENPLRILAELPLPIYLTTCYYDFMEDALRKAGKEPQKEVCYWYDGLDHIQSIFAADPDYQPTPEAPLVYHLHGVDDYPSSLVLTEDDHLDFLVKVSQDIEAIPLRIRQALVDSSLLLLGYQLNDWDFKVLFRGLIKTKRDSRRRFSLSIQYNPEDQDGDQASPKDVQEYLERYFDKANFDIYWGEPLDFAKELWQEWEAV